VRAWVMLVCGAGCLACSGLMTPKYIPREVADEAPPDAGSPEGTITVKAWYGSMDPIHCAGCTPEAVDALINTTAASSEAPAEGKRSHLVGMAFDHDPKTAWCADPGKEAGEWLEITFSAPVDLEGIAVHGGWFDGEYALFRHARVAGLLVLPDQGAPVYADIKEPPKGTTVQAANLEHPVTLDVGGWAGVTSIRFEVRDTWPGRDGKGVCISSLDLIGRPAAR
jgi:hypothetical protein